MLTLYIKKKYKKVLDEARRKSYCRGHKDGARVAGKEFQKITKEAEKQNKKKLEHIRHQLALQLQKDERFFAEMNNEILKMMA